MRKNKDTTLMNSQIFKNVFNISHIQSSAYNTPLCKITEKK